MDDFEELIWKGKDFKISELSDVELIRYHIMRLLAPFLTLLTRYYPFSLLWQDRRFHYRYKEVNDADERIIVLANKNGFWFKLSSYQRNRNILIIYGRFIPVKKGVNEDKLIEKFENAFKNEGAYISKPDAKTVKFSFIKS